MSLLEIERSTYRQMWAIEGYGERSPGERYASTFAEMARPEALASVLDAGCGSGKGALALAALGLCVQCCDVTDEGLSAEAKTLPFTDACLWHSLTDRLSQVDWVYCCDVMEHVPTAFTMLVAQNLLSIARCGVFFSICLTPDEFGAFIGKPLHQTVQSFVWWRESLRELGHVRECRDLGLTGLYLVEAE